jgi:hypothetical protein
MSYVAGTWEEGDASDDAAPIGSAPCPLATYTAGAN